MTLPSKQQRPIISVVIISYNMAREIPRTVQSFLPPYQLAIGYNDIEIIVMENGSSHPVDPEVVKDCLSTQFKSQLLSHLSKSIESAS